MTERFDEEMGNLKFPKNFILGVGTAAYQIEGSSFEDGRTESTWDVIRREGNRIVDGSDFEMSCESYKLWKEDVCLLKEIGVSHYRFSISWSRIFPEKSGKPNEKGLEFYANLIDELHKNGISPIVTLFHHDMPMYLFEEGGWLASSTIDEFLKLAHICFETFGDRVKCWITFNEITNFGWCGVSPQKGFPKHAPTRGDRLGVDERKQPYLAMHNMLLAHASAYRLYEQHYKHRQNGEIGLIITGCYCYADTPSNDDVLAQTRANTWKFHHILDPIHFGDYPRIMKDILGDTLPSFTEEQSKLIKGTLDIIGINYYRSASVKSFESEELCMTAEEIDGKFQYGRDLGERISGDGTWLRLNPEGLFYLLNYLKHEFGDRKFLITENGCADHLEAPQSLHDINRMRYISEHLKQLHHAIKEGVNVVGYLAWSLIDNFEWEDGFAMKFGLCRVDFSTPKKTRYLKDSARFYKNFIEDQRKFHSI